MDGFFFVIHRRLKNSIKIDNRRFSPRHKTVIVAYSFRMKHKFFTARNVTVAFIILLLIIFVAQTDVYLQSVKNGLNLYVTAVLPSMLPFFFFSKLLTELNFASDAGKLLSKPLAKLYSAPPVGGYVLIMSMLCGYPVGAKLVGELYDGGIINEIDGRKIAAFTSTSGPLFIVGTVGVSMFGNKTYGFVLLASHYIGALLNGLIYRGRSSSQSQSPIPAALNAEDVLNKSMLNTFLSVGIVGGYITIFNLLLDVCSETGLIPIVSRIMENLGVNGRITSGVAGGLIEMTKGCLMLSSSGFPIRITLPLCAFLIAFGGLSVTFQSLTFLSKIKISPAFYLFTKFTQGILSSLICFLLCLAF